MRSVAAKRALLCPCLMTGAPCDLDEENAQALQNSHLPIAISCCPSIVGLAISALCLIPSAR